MENTALLSPADPAPPQAQQPHVYALRFTGSGHEYFRIWIVNLLLTVLTLGVYSAWAKARRLQYFDRNTVLAGAVFRFHGAPLAILRGRVLAVVLAVAYHYAFGFSFAAGVATAAGLVLALPYLMLNSLRFRSRNTSYRGIRFGFDGGTGGAYLAYGPALLILLGPGLLAQGGAPAWVIGLSWLGFLAWPLVHAQLRAFQQGHLRFGAARAEYGGRYREFFLIYLAAAGIALAGIVAMVLILIVAAFGLQMLLHGNAKGAAITGVLGAVLGVYVFYLLTGPYVFVRIFNHVWNATRLDGLSFASRLSARGYLKLQTRNVVLTLLTLGLYRPWAAVATHRYRVEHMTVHTTRPLDELLADATQEDTGAAGEGAADIFGFDLSW
ncbi:MAG TPA: YjgN family protein [Telluria sp.]|nr:YjgN family protein [Telluria sp.]